MNDTWLPADQQERVAIATAVDKNLCVEAGAGTGKTHVLVDRALQVLRRGQATIDQMVIITFTERAAAELSTRIRREIEKAIADAPGDESTRLEDALRGLHSARIETIHAFAASLLRERPIEAALDPGFRVLDELPSQLAFDEAYAEWLTEQTAGDPPPALVDALNIGIKWTQVREGAERLNTHRDALPLPAYREPRPDFDSVFSALDEALREFDQLETGLRNPENTTAVEFRRMRRLQHALMTLRTYPPGMESLIAETRLPNVSGGSQDDWWPKSTRPKDALKLIRNALGEAQAAIRQCTTARLVHWLEGFVVDYQQRRRTGGVADFDDLLIWARDLLRGSEDARRYFRAKYTCFLVDEFQDTDPIQVEMIVRLCSTNDPSDWRESTLRPGSLFVVGDPKQSIYRFRRADIALYDDVKSGTFAGAVTPITQNFRSGHAIIDWVNKVFELLIAPSQGVQPAYTHLHPRETHPAGSVTLIPAATSDGSASGLRSAEAAAIASLIRSNIDSAAWQVRGSDGSLQPARLGDVTVLIPSRTELRVYEDACARAGVPYLHEGGRTFFQRQEVRDLTAILRAIDNPADESAIVAALRSEAFACSDDDLIVHREHANFNYLRVYANASGRVADSLRALRDLAKERHSRSLVSMVRLVIDRLRLIEAALLHHQGEQGAANILKVLDQARAYATARPGAGLRGFTRWMRTNLELDADETDASTSEESDDVVRILTIHASKGLEFPIVVFANMNTDRADRTNAIVSRQADQTTFEMKLGSKEAGFWTPGFEAADRSERTHAVAEQLRLLYVAATRAKDHLIVPLLAKDDPYSPKSKSGEEPKSLNGHLRRVGRTVLLSGGTGGVDVLDVASLPALPPEVFPPRHAPDSDPASVDALIHERQRWIDDRAAILASADRGLRVVTATSLKPEWEPIASQNDVRRGQATEFGTAVHAALERVPLDDASSIDSVCAAVAREHGFESRLDDLLTCVRNGLASAVVARALRANRVLREAPFTVAAAGGGMAEGRMDLLFIDDGDVVVVDFKSDDISIPEAVSRTRQTYRAQALAYAWAAHRATGLSVREVVFLYVRIPHEEVIPVDDAFMQEAEMLIAAPTPL